MHKMLLYHGDPDISRQLQADMTVHGWSIDVCDGMLEMLRSIEERDYETVILSSGRMNMELSMLMGTIRTLQKQPRIIVNLAEGVDSLSMATLADGGSIIRGVLTTEKLLESAEKEPQ